jgi:integrase
VSTPPRRSTPGDDTITFMTELIEKYLKHCRAAGLAENTIDSRGHLLRRLDRTLTMGLGQATTEELEDFLAGHPWPQTKATYFGHLLGFFRWATDPKNPRIDYDPTAGMSRPPAPATLPKPATNAQVAHALQVLKMPWRAVVAIAAYEGARCIEIARLNRADVTQETTRLYGKGSKTRVLRTHPEVWRIVEPLPSGPVVRQADGRAGVSAVYVSNMARYHLAAIGLDGLTLHQFRHWYATTQLKPVKYGGAGASIRTVKLNLGHSSVTSTSIYTAVTDEERADAISALPTFTTPTSC